MKRLAGFGGEISFFVNGATDSLTPQLHLEVVTEEPAYRFSQDGNAVQKPEGVLVSNNLTLFPEDARSLCTFINQMMLTAEQECDKLGGRPGPPLWTVSPTAVSRTISDAHQLGWNDESLLIHMGAFIASRCHPADFVEYLRKIAVEESKFIAGLPDEAQEPT